MAARPPVNAEIEIAAAYQLLIRVRELWSPPGDGILLIEQMATNRQAAKLQDYANDLLERHGETAQDVCFNTDKRPGPLDEDFVEDQSRQFA
jgi:hypothetical protein